MPSIDPEVTPAPGEPLSAELIRTHWALAICPRCEHESVQAEHCEASCPGCGRQLRRFALYQETTATPQTDAPPVPA